MKTNHQRDYVDSGSFRSLGGFYGLTSKIDRDISTSYIGNDFTKGHRGEAKAKRGAKKFIRSRDRLASKKLEKIPMEG